MKNLIKEYKKNYKNIEKYYKFLSKFSSNNTYVGLVNEWVLDNYYLLVKKQKWINESIESPSFYIVYSKNREVYNIIINTLNNDNYKLNDLNLYNNLNKYQDQNNINFTYTELSFAPELIYLSLIRKLSEICLQEYKDLKSVSIAKAFIQKLNPNFKINKYFELNPKMLYNFKFIENVYNGLSELGNKYDSYLKEFNEVLKQNSIDIRVTLERAYSTTADRIVMISNVFSTILSFNKINVDNVYSKVNKTEKVLLNDKYYKLCDIDTKNEYRAKIIYNSKKDRIGEYEYVKKFYDKNSQKHIGFMLFKKQNEKTKSILYIMFTLLLTLFLSFVLSKYLFKPQIISFLFLIIPISEIVIQITNKVVLTFTPRRKILKLDFSRGIPKKDKTMIVITTIINSKEKVLKLFEQLEKYYILNKSNNLYFSLLGDACSSSEQQSKNDEEVVTTGIEEIKRLNKKYGKSIFGFIYRNRFYNAGEDCYLGYERKRGALEHLNKLLLNEFNEKEKKYWFKCIKLSKDFQNVKYVITLDVDTDLSIGNAHKLIGAMAHPLNRPVLNKEGTKVIDGYSIIQPKVSVDIDASNKSIFTQIMAGLGGFDIYNSTVPELYQDVFDMASYCGKGIYDVKTFNKILGEKLPENKILSHDLLESCFVRCGYASDIELIDDYPSTFLADAKRRHRWARGDMQIFSYIFNKNISLICKWKIFDNIRRGLLDFSLLILLLIAYTVSITNPIYWFILVIIVILLPIIFYINEKLKNEKSRSTKIKQYKNIIVGLKSLLIRTFLMFSAIPYNAKLYVDAFVRSIYRMLVSKKHLLAWITAEDGAKADNKLIDYFWEFKINILFIGFFILISTTYGEHNLIPIIIMCLSFSISPIAHYLVSCDIKKKDNILSNAKNKEIKSLSYSTWTYFSTFLTKNNNYLIPDNYQETRDIKCDFRTSPTNIGMSLLSIISAFELKFITKNEAVDYIENIILTIKKLEKFRGHLYNWYNINTLKALEPLIISTVDSGNFVAALMISKNFLVKIGNTKLSREVEDIINKSNFKFLYSEEDNTFSVGYDVLGSGLIKYKYNIFASEARITSYIAISKGDIPYKNWFAFDKTLTKFNKYKGLISWNGTSFEYFMPLIFLKTYDNTLIDESYYFSYFCQKHYAKTIDINLPWGHSESAYNELDDSRNYKYYAFGTPNLKLKESRVNRVVVSPYASILAIEKYADDVYENLLKYKAINMYGKYGLYESYDYTDKTPVYSYFAHHQGMILSSVANYLTHGKIREYLYDDINIRAFDILNKEKTQIKPMIDNKINKLTKIEYNKESFKNSVRVYKELNERPEISVLSNSKYSILINDRGNGFSRFNEIQLNRYRKISEQNYGTFLYIRDVNTNKVWSNTYSPVNNKTDAYEVIYALNEIKYSRKDDGIITQTEIIVSSKHNAEIRKVTFINNNTLDKKLELTTYIEPIISNNSDDIGHRVFNNMFIKSSFDKKSKSLIFERKSRSSNDKKYMLHRLIVNNNLENYSYETLRNNFINRNSDYKDPTGLYKKLTNTTGEVIDPIGCIRNQINIKAGEKETIYIVNGVGRSIEQINDIINSYETKLQIKDAFNRTTIMTNRNITKLMVEENDISNYNKALNYLYQTTRINVTEKRMELLKRNNLSQNNLWKFSVSGDLPIILVEIDAIESLGLTKEILKMFEYYKSIGIFVELVLINNDSDREEIIKKEINNQIYKMYLINDFDSTPGKIVLINRTEIDDNELNLFRSIARLWVDASIVSSLQDYIELLQNNKSEYKVIQYKKLLSNEIKPTSKINYENKYGGFINNGKEYLIKTPDTPMPWINVLTNGVFGSVVSNNYNGFTFYKNSNEFKITSWTNETILDDKSEGITIDDEEVCFNLTTYGFGYAKYEFRNTKYNLKMNTFIPINDNVKVLILDIENLENKENNFELSYWINPVLGNNEDKTARHIVSDFNKEKNALYLENRYSMYFKNHTVYLSSSEDIKSITNTVIKKVINMNISLKSKSTKRIILTLGCDENIDIINNIILKYRDIKNAENSYDDTLSYWKNKLGAIKVDTPDQSFNYMINGWLSYQSIASRIYSRAGFYQVSGAFGFRDQLQDACNMIEIDEELLKKQILLCASHEFIEGDVLHWWHNENKFGLRSRYKDDYLWLIYATYKYIDITQDYNILNEQVPFATGDTLKPKEKEKGITFNFTDYTKTLYEHLRIIVDKAMKELATNGLPLIGGGDWNDGMNNIGVEGIGSSVWLGFFMYDVINKFIKINEHLNIKSTKEKKFSTNLKNSLKKYGYDKEYYLRAYFDDGTKLGTFKNDECKIDLISQAFAVITGIASKREQNLIDKNVDKYLVDKENKMIKLLTPAFDKIEPNPGYIKSYPKGIRENGGQYTHACSWYIIALIKMGKIDKAYEYYQMLNPINHTLTDEDVLKYKVEPYVISADIYSNENYLGQGGWTWYTGSAGWFYNVGIEAILGIKRQGNILTITPNVPNSWNEYKIEYKYKNTTYKITMVRKRKNTIYLDSVIVKGIVLIDDKKTHSIIIEFGGKNDKV